MKDTQSNKDNKEDQITPEVIIDIISLPSEEKNPVDQPFEQTIKIEWTPRELINELIQRKKIVIGFTKEAEAKLNECKPHERHIAHLERILGMQEVKVKVDAEKVYLASTAKTELNEELKVKDYKKDTVLSVEEGKEVEEDKDKDKEESK